jgi:hypothetical protein
MTQPHLHCYTQSFMNELFNMFKQIARTAIKEFLKEYY